MSRTITALFDTRADAEAGRERLLEAQLHADHVRIHDKTTIGDAGYSSAQQPGMWASIKNAFLPDEDRHLYEEGVRRGGYLLVADVDEDRADQAVRALEETHLNGVDVDERANQWKSQGWQPPIPSISKEKTAAVPVAKPDISHKDLGTEQKRFDVVEEQLVVGKREVDRGGVRVRSYITETPVHEQIRLREEKVRIERHPIDKPIADVGNAFQERSFEVTETAEEAVVSKTARVVEEVVINKTADTHVEVVNDTVRRTEVQVENIDGGKIKKS